MDQYFRRFKLERAALALGGLVMLLVAAWAIDQGTSLVLVVGGAGAVEVFVILAAISSTQTQNEVWVALGRAACRLETPKGTLEELLPDVKVGVSTAADKVLAIIVKKFAGEVMTLKEANHLLEPVNALVKVVETTVQGDMDPYLFVILRHSGGTSRVRVL